MRNRHIIIAFILAAILFAGLSIYAAPIANVLRSVLPETGNQYYLGTSTPSRLEWADIFTRNLTVTSGSATTTLGTATSILAGSWGFGTGTPGTIIAVTGGGVFTDKLTSLLFRATSTSEASIFPIASTTSFSVSDRLWVAGAGTSTFQGSIDDTNHLRVGSLEILGACKGCPGGTPGGLDRQIQFNNSAVFGGSDQFILTAGNLVGIGTGTPGTALGVIGGGVFTDKVMAPVFYATSTEASIFKGGITLTCTGCITDANAVDSLTLTNITQITTRPITSLTTSAAAGLVFLSDGANPATNARLTFNTANEFLGVATATPGSHLSVNGNILTKGTTTSPGGILAPAFYATSSLSFYTTNTNQPRMIIDSNGNVGIATGTPANSAILGVTGDTFLWGGLGIGEGTTTDGDLRVNGLTLIGANDGSATSTLQVGDESASGKGGVLRIRSVDTAAWYSCYIKNAGLVCEKQ